MMLINCKSNLYGMQAVIGHFKERRQGQIINVSSMLGRIPFASMRSAYCAAKHALNSITCSMRVDMQNQGYNKIHVTTLHPGPVQTLFGVNAMHGGPDNRTLPGSQPVGEVAESMASAIENPRPDVYTREAYHDMVTKYYSAKDVREIESRPPFTHT
eukprot:Colp12_sorted_trinity150504_noHs@18205